MNFWKTMVADRKMLTVQAAFWTIYAFILYARNVWMPEDDHKYSLGHVVGILIVILCVFYAMAWLFWMLGHSNKTIKWVIAIVAFLVVLLPLLALLFYKVFPDKFNLWFFDPAKLPSIGMFIYRVAQKFFHFGAEAGLLVSRYIIQERAEEKRELTQKNHELHIRFITGVVNPHFLMNTLQAINNGIRKVDQGVAGIVDKLAELLHYGLRHAKEYTTSVALTEEVWHAHNYLDILSHRYQRNFTECLRIAGDTASWILPPVTLTTILENVFAHGAIKSVEGLPFTLTIEAGRERLTITCRNTRRKRTRRWQSTGIGLDTVRQRLHAAFGDNASLKAYPEGDEFISIITITRQ